MNQQNVKDAVKMLASNRYLFFRGNPRQRSIALTFDDGPCTDTTESVLSVLRRRGIRASFFLVGSAAERYPQVVRRIAGDGHEIGVHSYSHRDLAAVSAVELAQEMEESVRVIHAVTGKRPVLFRPPFGSVSIRLLRYAVARGFRIIQWSKDLRDSFDLPVEQVRERLQHLLLEPGDVLLLHDDSPVTPLLLPELLDHIERQGFSFLTVGEMQKGGRREDRVSSPDARERG